MDKIVHEPSRLAILTALSTNRLLSFRELKELTKLTDGVLSVQTKKLEEAGYIIINKEFVERKPLTTYEITKSGRRSFSNYLKYMETLIAKIDEIKK